jgi:FeS assembly SUF system regulator
MLKISKLSDYATTLLAHLAATQTAHSATQLGMQTRLPLATVSKLLKLLSKAKLVQATRGANGGYELARAPSSVTIADVLAAVDGPLGITHCTTHDEHCERSSFCATQSHWQTINKAVIAALESISLEDLAQSQRHPYVDIASGESLCEANTAEMSPVLALSTAL